VLIGLQRRQVFRLLRGLKRDGATSLLSKRRGRPSNHRLPDEVRTLALSIVRERCSDFGPSLARQRLRLGKVAPDKDRAIAGCIVTIGDDGEFRLHEGVVERSAIRGGNGSAAAETGVDGDEEFASGPSEDDEMAVPAPSPTGEQAVRKECGFSHVLVDDLKAHRLQITRAHLAGDFGVAFDLALYSLASGLLHQGYRSRPLDKNRACVGCHQLGPESTRTIPAPFSDEKTSEDAWMRRVQSGRRRSW
jgi:hypothetical protein